MSFFSSQVIPPPCRPFPWRLLTISSLLVVGSLWLLSASSFVNFDPFFGRLPPASATTIACSLGIASLFALQRRFGYCVTGADTGARGPLTAAAISLPFMVAVTGADLFLGFPAGTHVDLPIALAFYPLMALIAQLVLHLLPFAIVLWVLSQTFVAWPLGLRIRLAVVLSASVEAVFQVADSAAPSYGLTLLSAFVAIQVFAFGLTELYIFRRFDFVSMYFFRLTYYGYWHILWGNLIRPPS